MNIRLKMLMAAALGAALVQLPARAQDKPAFKDDKEKASYALGEYFGNIVKNNNLDVDLDVAAGAMKDLVAGRELKLNPQQVQATLQAYQQQARAKLGEKNKKDGETFLAENKTKPGVQTKVVTLSGTNTAEMQYKVLTQGAGPVPGSNDVVEVNYRGTMLDGKEFDNSAKHGTNPSSFPVRAVVRGWTEALEMMKTGSKWQLWLPSSLAYGDNGGRGIEPGATLVFDVELVGIKPPPPPPAPAQPLTSDIIKVPSAEEMKKGAKIEVLKPEDAAKLAKEQANPAKK